jgi:hypothetical protein
LYTKLCGYGASRQAQGLRIELPDYASIALKWLAAEQMGSLRHVIMTALRTQGISINDADMIEDGRRNRE